MYVDLYDVQRLIPWNKRPSTAEKFHGVEWVQAYGDHLSETKYNGLPWKVCKQTLNCNRGRISVFPEIASLYMEWLNGTNGSILLGRVRDIVYPTQSLYLIQCQEFHKVGISQSFQNRLGTIQSATPFDVNVIKVVNVVNALEYESRLHKKFDSQNVRGEWFKLTFPQIQEIIQFMEKAERESLEFIPKPKPATVTPIASQLSLFA